MLHASLTLLILVAPWLPGPVSPAPAEAAGQGQLSRAREAFAAADRDGDGSLDLAEIRAVGIPIQAAGAHDEDADGRLSPGEFLVYYQALLLNAGRTVEPELERAVREVLASRRERFERERASRDLRRRLEREGGGGGLPRARITSEARERIAGARAELEARPDRPTRHRPVQESGSLARDVDRGVEPLLGGIRERLEGARSCLARREERLAALGWTRPAMQRGHDREEPPADPDADRAAAVGPTLPEGVPSPRHPGGEPGAPRAAARPTARGIAGTTGTGPPRPAPDGGARVNPEPAPRPAEPDPGDSRVESPAPKSP